MKFFLIVFFALIFSITSWGQSIMIEPESGSSSPHYSAPQTSYQTPFSISLSNNFLFLVDDEIQQVMFNPARASIISQGFVMGSFMDRVNGNYAAASLVPAKSGSWFFTIGGKVETSSQDTYIEDYEQSLDQTTNFDDERTIFQESFDERKGLRDWDNSQVEFRLLKIFDSEAGEGKALGFFGALVFDQFTDRRNNFDEDYSLDLQFRMDTLYRSREIEREETFNDLNERFNNKLRFGIEFYGWKLGSDFRQRLYVQHTDYRQNNQNTSNRQEIEEELFRHNQLILTEQNLEGTNIAHSTTKPWLFQYDLYKNFELNVWGNDYLFGNLQLVYGFGSQDIESENELFRTTTENGVLENSFTEEYEVSFDDPVTDFMGGRFSAGYAISIGMDDVTLLTGLNPYYELSNESINEINGLDKRTGDIIKQRLGADLPVFGMFKLSDNFKIWGGTSLSFYHQKIKNDFTITALQKTPDHEVPDIEQRVETKQADLTQSTFAGIGYQHSSGLGINANTRGNISNITNWFLSVSYRF